MSGLKVIRIRTIGDFRISRLEDEDVEIAAADIALELLGGLTDEMVTAVAERLISFDLYDGRMHWTDENLKAEATDHARAALELAFDIALQNPFVSKD